MRAIVVERRGGPETLTLTAVPAPRPGPGELLVRVTAAGVNYLDVFHRTGHYDKPLPFIPGIDGCGVVTGTGPGAAGFGIGDRVAWVMQPGSYAEQVALPAERAVTPPAGVSDTTAAAGLMHGLAARYLTEQTYPVGPGTTVLVRGAGAGMRLLVTQLAVAKGARVIAVVVPRDARLAREAGAEVITGLPPDRVTARVQELTSRAGVDVIYDGVGAAAFTSNLACLRPRGLLAVIAELSGAIPPFDPALLTAGSFYFTRPVLGHHIWRRQDLETGARDVFRWLSDGTLRPRLDQCYPLADADDAHRALEQRHTGKPVLLPLS